MTDEYRSQFISSLILSAKYFRVDEFENFVATIEKSTLPLFSDMVAPWRLKFSINENNKLAWSAVEYDDEEEDMHGLEVKSGLVRVVVRADPRAPSDTIDFDVSDPDAHEFIETMFPGSVPNVVQCHPDRNMFLVNGRYYNFETMVSSEHYLDFEFVD